MTPIDYIRIEADILTRHDLSDKSKMLLGLIQSMNGKGLRLSNEHLAKLLCTTAKNISRIMSGLESNNYITITAGQSRWRKIYFRKNGEVQTKILPQKSESKPVLLPHLGGYTSAKMRTITKGTKETTLSRGDDVPKSFDVFWKAYPKKVSKPQAQKAFRTINPDDALLDAMLTALERHKVSDQWQKDGGKYIPYPATWLNGRRWEDKLTIDGDCPQPREITESEADEIFLKAGIA